MFFFDCTTDSDYVIYAGEDKFENELLIKYAWPEDIWFHVDNFSSAHIYLRRANNPTFEAANVESMKRLPESVVMECAQLTKENSIKGKIQKN